MAIDTKAKRASVVNNLARSTVPPPPSGTIGAAARRHLAGLYAGLASSPAPPTTLAAYPDPFAATSRLKGT